MIYFMSVHIKVILDTFFFLNNKSINKIKEYRSSLKTCHKINRDFQFNIQSMIYFMSVHIKAILDKNVFV